MTGLVPPEIFDREKRRAAYHTAVSQPEVPLFHKMIAEDMIERVAMVTRRFETVLVVNPVGSELQNCLQQAGSKVSVAALSDAGFEEDRANLPQAAFDLVLVPWGLDSVNDLPGALFMFRAAMKQDSLLLACFPGAGSFANLREAIRQAEVEMTGQMQPRFHPQIDVRATGDLLQRAGFTLPVIDIDTHALRYRSLAGVLSDIRNHGWGNALSQPAPRIENGVSDRAQELFITGMGGEETLNLITITAWTPGENQPQPAARGSGQKRLSQVLGQKRSSTD